MRNRSRAAAALVAVLALSAAPLLARLCEIACGDRAEHCHEAGGKAPSSCPDKSHRSDAPSLVAGKAAAESPNLPAVAPAAARSADPAALSFVADRACAASTSVGAAPAFAILRL